MAYAVEPRHQCPTCGAANAGYATFCYECGEPLDGAAQAPGTGSESGAGRRELVLGLALALVVLGIALGDWWHREDQERTYAAGVAAATRYAWEQAATIFGGLGDYRDAAGRSADAVHLVQRRDARYQAGRAAVQAQDWIAAVAALSETLTIQPAYRDAPALLATASAHATGAALAQVIARRPAGPAPGLYVRPGGRPEWRLPRSDGASRVRASDAAGTRVVYDAPDGAAAPDAGPAEESLPPDRVLLLADVRPAAGPPALLSRAFGLGGHLLLAQSGIWWYGQLPAPLTDYAGAPLLSNGLAMLSYYDYQSRRTLTARLDSSSFYLLQADPAAGRLLIGQHDPSATHTRFYLAGPTGWQLHSLLAVDGLVLEARLSPDGQTLLYTTLIDPTTADAQLELTVLDLHGPAPVVLFREGMIYEPRATTLTGELVPGPAGLRALVRRQSHDLVRWDLHDPATASVQTLWEGPPGRLAGDTLAADGRSVLFWTLAPDSGAPALVIQALDGALPATRQVRFSRATGSLLTLHLFWLAQVGLYGDTLTYLDTADPARPLPSPPEPATLSLYTLPLEDTGAAPALLLQARQQAPGAPGLLITPSHLVVYATASGDLRLRALDGRVDLPGIPGADAVWPLSQP